MSYHKKDPMIGVDGIKHLISYLEQEIRYCEERIRALYYTGTNLPDYYKGKRDGYVFILASMKRTLSYYENGIPMEPTQLNLPLPIKEEV